MSCSMTQHDAPRWDRIQDLTIRRPMLYLYCLTNNLRKGHTEFQSQEDRRYPNGTRLCHTFGYTVCLCPHKEITARLWTVNCNMGIFRILPSALDQSRVTLSNVHVQCIIKVLTPAYFDFWKSTRLFEIHFNFLIIMHRYIFNGSLVLSSFR